MTLIQRCRSSATEPPCPEVLAELDKEDDSYWPYVQRAAEVLFDAEWIEDGNSNDGDEPKE